MFLLNPGRYIISDPEIALSEDTFKKLWGSNIGLNSLGLDTFNGRIIALPTHGNGEFRTTLGKSLATNSSCIAFLPCAVAEKLLPSSVIRLNLDRATLLFVNAASDIVLDGRLTIFCGEKMRECNINK